MVGVTLIAALIAATATIIAAAITRSGSDSPSTAGPSAPPPVVTSSADPGGQTTGSLPTPVTSGKPSSVDGQIKREGTTTFGDLVQIDFDSNSPDWGVSDRGSGHDVRTLGGEILVYGPGALGYFGNHPPTYQDCRAFANYSQPDKSLWLPGKSFCLRTSEGRYASITMKPNGGAAKWSITASIVVWKSQADAP